MKTDKKHDKKQENPNKKRNGANKQPPRSANMNRRSIDMIFKKPNHRPRGQNKRVGSLYDQTHDSHGNLIWCGKKTTEIIQRSTAIVHDYETFQWEMNQLHKHLTLFLREYTENNFGAVMENSLLQLSETFERNVGANSISNGYLECAKNLQQAARVHSYKIKRSIGDMKAQSDQMYAAFDTCRHILMEIVKMHQASLVNFLNMIKLNKFVDRERQRIFRLLQLEIQGKLEHFLAFQNRINELKSARKKCIEDVVSTLFKYHVDGRSIIASFLQTHHPDGSTNLS